MKKFIALVALLAWTLAATPAPSWAPRVDSYLQGLSREGKFSGNVLVVQNGRTEFEKSYGYADWELRVANTPKTRFRIHSTSKQVVATATLQLVQTHAISLDRDIVSILPQLPKAWSGVTVRELLNHTSGIPADEDAWASSFMTGKFRTQLANLDAIAPSLRDQKLESKPGATFKYNNFGYDLLGCIIEKVSGETLEDYMRQHVFEPAHMTDSLFQGQQPLDHEMYSSDAVVANLANGYNGAPNEMETANPQMYASAGAGGMVTTARDLCRYDAALTAGTILSPELEQLAQTDTVAVSETFVYGLGWMVITTSGGKTVLHHSGGNNGYLAEYLRIPGLHTCIVVLSNYGFAPITDVRNRLLVEIGGKAYVPPIATQPKH